MHCDALYLQSALKMSTSPQEVVLSALAGERSKQVKNQDPNMHVADLPLRGQDDEFSSFQGY